MRRAILWVIGIGLGIAALVAVALRAPAVQDRLLERAFDRLGRTRPDSLFENNALRALLCGTASPLPHPSRAKPCVAVFAGGRFWVVDTGPGSWNKLALWRVDASRIGGVFLTHFHSDHIGELGEFNLQTWAAGRSGPLQVFGPPGVERVVAGFTEAYALDTRYRIAHHGVDLLPEDVSRMEARVIAGPATGIEPAIVLEEGGLTIRAFAVNHSPVRPAYGYRFDYQGRSVVVSGDTVKNPDLIQAAKGTDVLLHEAQANHLVALIRSVAEKAGRSRVAQIMGDISSYHTSPVEAAEAANEAGVKLLVLYHLTPPPPGALIERVFVRGVSEVRSEGWLLADDGLLLELPINSDAVNVTWID